MNARCAGPSTGEENWEMEAGVFIMAVLDVVAAVVVVVGGPGVAKGVCASTSWNLRAQWRAGQRS